MGKDRDTVVEQKGLRLGVLIITKSHYFESCTNPFLSLK